MTTFTTFENNTANDSNDLIGKMKTFLETNGFIIEDFFQEGNGQRLHVSKNGLYYNFKSFTNESPFSQSSTSNTNSWQSTDAEPYNSGICGNVSKSYDNTLDYDRQLGSLTDDYSGNEDLSQPQANPILTTDGPIIEYDFFYNEKVFYIVCQFNSGYYSHMAFGELDKMGDYEGGSFISATFYHRFSNFSTTYLPTPSMYAKNYQDRSYYANQVLINKSVRKMSGLIPTNENNQTPIYNFEFIRKSKNPFLNGKGTLIPESFYTIEKIDNTYKNMPIGTVNGVYMVYFENYTPKEIITIGSRIYVVFPFWKKESPWDDTDKKSSGLGLAIQVDNNYTA